MRNSLLYLLWVRELINLRLWHTVPAKSAELAFSVVQAASPVLRSVTVDVAVSLSVGSMTSGHH